MVVGSAVVSTLSSSSESASAASSPGPGRTFEISQDAARIGERLGQVVNERHLRLANANDLACLEHVIAADRLAGDDRAIAAFQVANDPMPLRVKQLGMGAAAAFVFDDDLIRRRRPIVTACPGTSRNTSVHFEPSRMTR